MKKAIIFDVDGTLLKTERIYMESWIRASEALGYQITQQVLLRTRAVSTDIGRQIFCQACGEDFPYDTIREERVRIAEEIIAAADPASLRMPGVRETLERLRREGHPLAVASSTPLRYTRPHLEHTGLWDFFQVAVTGEMVTRGKPDPEIFLEAARRLGRSPETCVVVGDTPADVLGGHAAGMEVYLIPDQVPANPETRALSRRVLESLARLPEELEE